MADEAANDRPPTVPIALSPANPISATAEIALSVQLYIGFINCLFCSVE